MHRMQVSCSDQVRCWSYSRALDDASKDVGQLRYTSSELSAVGVSVEEVLYPEAATYDHITSHVNVDVVRQKSQKRHFSQSRFQYSPL